MSARPSPDQRCQRLTRDFRRCRMTRLQGQRFCRFHWQRRLAQRDPDSIGDELLGPFDDFTTATAVNHALGKLFALLARDLIPARRAAVLGYVCQLALTSLPAVKSEARLAEGRDRWRALLESLPPQPPPGPELDVSAPAPPDEPVEPIVIWENRSVPRP